MTFPTVGPASQTTGNVAGGPYAAWSGTIQASVIGPAGSLVPLGQFGALYDGTHSISSGTAVFSDANGVSFGFNGQTITASAAGGGVVLNAGANSISTGTAVFSNANGVTFGIVGQTITASVPAVGGAQTGISSIADSANTQTVGMLSFSNAGGVSFGLSTGVSTATLTASVAAQSVQTQASGNIAATGFATTTTNGVVIVGTNNTTGLTLAVPPYLTTAMASNAGSNFVGLNTAETNVTWTVNSSGVSLNAAGYAGTGTTFGGTNVSATMTLNSAGLVLSLSGGAGGGGGAAISAAGSSQNAGTIVFSNSNNVSFGMNGSTITATATAAQSNQAFSAQGGSSNFQTLVFTNSNNVSFSNTGGSVWGSYALNVSANGGTSNALSGLTFANSNGVTFGLSTGAGIGTLTASVAAAGGAQTGISGFADSAETQTVGTISFSNKNNVSFGLSTGANTATMTASYALNVSAGGGTSNALSALTFSNSNGMTFGLSTGAGVGTMTASYTVPSIAGLISAINVSQGTTSENVTQIDFCNSNNVSFLLSTAGGGPFASIYGSYGLNVSAGAGTSNALSGITFPNSNGITFGLSTGAGVGTMTASYNSTQFAGLGTTFAGANISGSMTVNSAGVDLSLSVGSAGGSTGAIYFDGNTTGQSTQSTYTLASLNVSGAGLVSAGWSSNSLIISGPATTALQAITAVADSANTQTTGMISFANSNGITFGISTGAATATITASALGVTTAGWYATGNTTNNSSTSLALSSILLNALGAQTVGYSNGSIQLSVPATSSLVGVNDLSVSTNASTISVSLVPLSTYVPNWPASTASQVLVANLATNSASAYFYPFTVPNGGIAFDVVNIAQYFSNSASIATSYGWTGSFLFGLYSNNASSWSQISASNFTVGITSSGVSGTLSYPASTGTGGYSYATTTATTTAQAASFWGQSGTRVVGMQFGGSMSLSHGLYALGVLSLNASANHAGGQTGALVGNVWASNSSAGPYGVAPGNSTSFQYPLGLLGIMTASTGALPAGIAWTNLDNTLTVMPHISFLST